MKISRFSTTGFEVFSRQFKGATIVVMTLIGVLILRLWFLQVVDGPAYRSKSEKNHIRFRDIPPLRGMIFDRHGALLVGNRPSYDLFVIPEDVQDPEQLTDGLTHAIGLEAESVRTILKKSPRGRRFMPRLIKANLARDELGIVESKRYNLPGILIQVKPRRDYVHGALAAHLLGYLGEIGERQLNQPGYQTYKPGDFVGKSGVEAKWQVYLHGLPGGEQVEVDASGRQLAVLARTPPIQGYDVHLTIDRELQAVAERLLAERRGAIVALDPSNGEILAMASSPAFDPNAFVGGIESGLWKEISTCAAHPLQNRAICGQYPPGSVFKIVVALAGLEEKVIKPGEKVYCSGSYALGAYRYRCWRRYGHGEVDLHRALVESCDVYFYKLGKSLGLERIAAYAGMCGLGQPSGFDLGGEKPGLVPSNPWKKQHYGVSWQTGETISLAIGQSFLTLTPLQAANLIAAIFNGGVLYRPHVTQWVGLDPGRTVFRAEPEVLQRLDVSRENLRLVQDALVGVVNETRGTGKAASLEPILVAGKTGTAQVISAQKLKDAGRDEDIPFQFRDHAWFVATAPALSPRIAVAVLMEHGGHGGSAAAPLAQEIIRTYLQTTPGTEMPPARVAGTGPPPDYAPGTGG